MSAHTITPVALVGPTDPAPGGIAQFTAGLADALANRGEVLVVGWTRRFPARLYPGTLNDTISQTRVGAQGEPILDLLDPRSWRHAAQRIVHSGAATAVLQWWHASHAPVVISLARSLRRHGIAVVVICHNVEPHESNAVWRRLTRRALSQADALIVHSPALVPVAERAAPGVPIIAGFLPAFMNVADAAGLATPEAIADVRRRYGASDRPLLLCFGYVRPYKGVDDAIDAMAHVTHDAVLAVVGECWDGADHYAARRDAIGKDRVRLDFRYVANEELPSLFGAAAAVVVPYRAATQSGVAALAMAYRRPMIATATGGLPDVVTEGTTGALAPPRDPRALAAAVDRVLASDRDWGPAIAEMTERLSFDRYLTLIDAAASAAPHPERDHATHAMLEPGGRRARAAKLIAVLRRERPLDGATVLDVGTGNGTIAAELATAVGADGSVTSVDVTDVRVDRDGFAFLVYDGSTLPFDEGSFDVVVSNHVIEHVGDGAAQSRHVREIARVLRPDGVAYVACPHRWQMIENHYRLIGLGWLRGRSADRYLRVAHRHGHYDCRPLGRGELIRLVRSAGLEARDATADLIAATREGDAGRAGRLLRRLPTLRHVIRGPALPSIVAIARKPR